MGYSRFFLTLFGLSFLLLGFSNCGGSKTNKSTLSLVDDPPFIIKEVYYQNWIAGIKGGGSGTNLFIAFSEIKKNVIMEDFFFRNKKINAQRNQNDSLLYIGYFKNEKNSDVIMDTNPIKEAQNTPPIKFPFQLNEDEAVISYHYQGELFFFKVLDIIEKDVIAYPETKPKID